MSWVLYGLAFVIAANGVSCFLRIGKRLRFGLDPYWVGLSVAGAALLAIAAGIAVLAQRLH